MKSKGLICCILVVSLFCASFADDINITVTVTVTGNAVIAETDESFVCVTLDWWPPTKCDYGPCPWGKAGILNLDLNSTILENAVKAFGNLRIRVGGSLQDQVFYDVGGFDGTCSDFTRDDEGLFHFSSGCLDMNRWDLMLTFFNKTGAVITFGLNALNGRNKSPSDNTLMVGDWNYTNALDFMKYTLYELGYTIDSFEFGNELSGNGIGARVGAEQYANDTKVLKNLIKSVHSNSTTIPRLLGPGGFYNDQQKQWFTNFLNALGPDDLDALTHHVYNLGPGYGDDVLGYILNPDVVNGADDFYNSVSNDIIKHTAVWVSESGGAFSSGKQGVSDTYANGFWYLNQLGLASIHKQSVFCRQTLIGGYYGLLDVDTFIPKPDYYGALLWHRLMGKKVLSASHNGTQYLRIYAHCSKLYIKGVSLLIINMSNSTLFEVSVEDIYKSYPNDSPQNRTEYHLTPENSDILSKVVLVNGTPLKLTGKSDIPEFNPSFVNATSPIRVDKNSMVFATIDDYNATVCTD